MGLLDWPIETAAAIESMDNCAWAELAETDAGRLRLSSYNTRVGLLTPIRIAGRSLAKIPGVAQRDPGDGGAVAQLVAHLHGMQGVRGSNPLSSTL